MPSFNILSLLISACMPLLVGSLWYSPKVFGNAIARENEKSEHAKTGHPAVVYGLTYVAGILMSMLLTGVLSTHAPADQTILHGMFHGGGVSVFMAIPAFAVIALFENKSAKYIGIHAGYWFLSLVLMGGVVGGMI